MIETITANLGTVLTATLVLLASAAALRSVLRAHKEGGCSGGCGGNCETCGQRAK